MTYEFSSAVDAGRMRANNEDAVIVDEASGLAILADGMGGYNAGEVASHMVTTFVASELGRWLRDGREALPSVPDTRRAMEICVDNANRAIFNSSNSNPNYAGMGTTLVVGVFRPSQLILGHVGDSRAYRLRAGKVQQLTRDHSLLQEQLDSGLITPEEAKLSQNKNLVTKALGIDPTVEPELHVYETEPGDIYLLCSDGLNDMVEDEEIRLTLITLRSNPSLTVQQLVQAANDNGGRDNVSTMLIRVAEPFAVARGWLARFKALFR
jgi:protein phosphatase